MAGFLAMRTEAKRRARKFVRNFFWYIVGFFAIIAAWQALPLTVKHTIEAYLIAIPISLLIAVGCASAMFFVWQYEPEPIAVRIEN